MPAPLRFTRPWLYAALLWLSLAAVAALALWHLRHEAVAAQARELSLLSIAATDAVDRGLRGAEEGLHVMRAELDEGHLALDGEGTVRALNARVGLMPLVDALWVLDAQGRTVAASSAQPVPAAAGFYPPLAQLGPEALAVSQPFRAGVAPTGAGAAAPAGEFVALAVRYRGPGKASGGGWIVAATPAGGLIGGLGEALPAAAASMLVFRGDGARLSAANVEPAHLAGYEALGRQPGGAGQSLRTLPDGTQHLLSTRAVPRYGVTVTVSRDIDAALTPWWQAAELAAAALAVLLLVMASAVHFVRRADRRRAEAQAALQAQVSRAGKLESLGTLAGGVAHDFNNVLAGIVGYGEMAQDAAVPGSAQARHLERAMQAALRGKALVERILAFSRGGAKASTVFELEPVVQEVLTLLAASLRPGIVLERLLEAPGARLKGDATQAFEAVMNLCTNAMQAMPEGGMLSVHLRRERVHAPRVLSHTRLQPGEYLALAVADQGGGISPQVMEHLFEPFFTTKAAQSGTGLGLAVVFGVVAEFGGAIDVRSSPGQGARFTLYLPESREGVAEPEEAPPALHRGAGQRVLVVDDDPALVALAVEMLQGLGYAPEGFTDAGAALQALQQAPTAWGAVITDEVMPGLTGTQLTQALRPLAPQLPVLLVSGYGGALLAQRASQAGVTRVLAKPLQRNALGQALQELLRG